MSGAGRSPRLASIHIYPLKAGRAVDLAESVAEPWGLAGSPSPMPGRRRRFGQQLVFGQNMIPDTPGSIRPGDPVQVLEESGQLSWPPKRCHAPLVTAFNSRRRERHRHEPSVTAV